MTWILPAVTLPGGGRIRSVPMRGPVSKLLGEGESGKRGFPARASKPRSGESQKHGATEKAGFTRPYEVEFEGMEKRSAKFVRAYNRAYYHAKRKGRKQIYTPLQSAQRNAQRREVYQHKLEKMRADARARYWKHRDRYAAAARERARAKRAK